MPSIYEIPLTPQQQQFQISLNGINYSMRLYYADCDQGGWVFDLLDSAQTALLCGQPLVTGADLMAQYPLLGFGGQLWVYGDTDRSNQPPAYSELGVKSHLYFITVP